MTSSPFETVDCVVIGAGVVGLAVARALALAGREVIVVEAAEGIGTETSSRNSEVIHAGIYYPKGSLMARTCVAGRRLLYAYCAEHGVPHRNCGKLIVATNEAESAKLAEIKGRAEANGVEGMRLLSAAEAMAMEPNLQCTAALLSPSHRHHRQPLLHAGAAGRRRGLRRHVAFHSPVQAAPRRQCRHRARGRRRRADEAALPAGRELAPACMRRRWQKKSSACHPTACRTAYYAKGNYFTLTGRSPFSRLIYPVPVPGGLGVHITVDMGGQAKFGPDVEWIDGIDYTVDPAPRRQVLCRRAPLLARPQGRRAAAGLCRHPAQDRAAGRAGAGLRRAGTGRSRRARPHQPLRHRIARPHRLAGAGRAGARHRLRT